MRTRQTRESPQRLFRIADEQLARGETGQVRQTLVAFQSLPEPRLQLAQAEIEIEEGRFETALARLDSLAPPGVNATTYYHLRGVALEGLGRWHQAGIAYQAGYEAQPDVHLLRRWLDALVRSGHTPAARRILAQERYRFSANPELHVLASRLRESSADDELTRDTPPVTTDQAVPHSFATRLPLAESYDAAQRYDEAATIWQQLVTESRSARQRQRLRHRLARCLLSADRFADARRVYRALVLTQPADATARLGLATACLLSGEPAEALDAALRVLQTDRQNANAQLIAALCYQRLNQPARAAELLPNLQTDDTPDALIRELLVRENTREHAP